MASPKLVAANTVGADGTVYDTVGENIRANSGGGDDYVTKEELTKEIEEVNELIDAKSQVTSKNSSYRSYVMTSSTYIYCIHEGYFYNPNDATTTEAYFITLLPRNATGSSSNILRENCSVSSITISKGTILHSRCEIAFVSEKTYKRIFHVVVDKSGIESIDDLLSRTFIYNMDSKIVYTVPDYQ